MDPSTPAQPITPTYFEHQADLRGWLTDHHAEARELWVGFYKKASGRPSITWPQAVDEALSFGWIDGQRRRIDDERYTIRFTARKRGSIWSARNLTRVPELIEQGLMRPEGLAAYEARSQERSAVYAYEQVDEPVLEPEQERELRAHEHASAFFDAQAPFYRRAAIWWVVSAKRPETRSKRLRQLIEDSAHGRTVHLLTPGRNPGDRERGQASGERAAGT